MWCDRIVRNAADAIAEDWRGRRLDYVDLHWTQCGRILKAQTRAGEPVRVLLPLGQRVTHDDVLFEDENRAVVVHVLPCEVIVAKPAGARDAALLALELGNLHWPAQITETEIVFVEDGPAMEAAIRLNVPFQRETRPFQPTAVVLGTGVRISPILRIFRRPLLMADQAKAQ